MSRIRNKNNYLYRSQFRDIIRIFPFATVFSLLLYYHQLIKLGNSGWLLILIVALVNYLMLVFQSRYYFYDDYVVRIFVFRPFFRRTVFKYNQISKIRFIHVPAYGTKLFEIYQKKMQFFTFKGFKFKKHADRVQIVKFLLSKNVQIELRTDYAEKDKEIIDMVKRKYPPKKYPKNIRLDPQMPESYHQRILKN